MPRCVARFLALASLLALSPASWAIEGSAKVQTAAASCRDDSTDIYVDCGNGTVTDNRTGLTWLKDANCFGAILWYEAKEAVDSLADLPANADLQCGGPGDTCDCGLSDGSSPGEWRLPSISEWQAMVVAGIAAGCSPVVTSDQGIFCWGSLECVNPFLSITCSFENVQSVGLGYWSSSAHDESWVVELVDGELFPFGSLHVPRNVWPVRGGQ